MARQRLTTAEARLDTLQQAIALLPAIADQLRNLVTQLDAVPTTQQLIDLEERIGETANRAAIAIHDRLVPRIIQLEGLSATKEEVDHKVDQLKGLIEELRRSSPAEKPAPVAEEVA